MCAHALPLAPFPLTLHSAGAKLNVKRGECVPEAEGQQGRGGLAGIPLLCSEDDEEEYDDVRDGQRVEEDEGGLLWGASRGAFSYVGHQELFEFSSVRMSKE